MPSWRTLVIVALAAPLVVFGATSAAWAIDTRGDATDRVARGVELAGVDVGGMSRDELEDVVDGLATELAGTGVTIDAGDVTLDVAAGDVGVAVDRDATVEAVLAAGRDDPGPLGPIRWARALLTPRDVQASLTVDRATVLTTVEALEGDRRTTPVEPRLEATPDAVTVVPGSSGRAIDLDAVVEALPRRSVDVGRPITVEATRPETPPRMSDEEVAELAATAEANTAGELELRFGDTTAELDATRLRPGFAVSPSPDGPVLTLDEAVVATALSEAVPQPANPTGVTFTIEGGRPVPVAGRDAVVCCAADAPASIVAAVLAGESAVTIGSRTVSAAEGVEWASTLGVREVVGEFTTRHPAGQPRVQNIHRISDMTRGQLVAPGASWSVNDTVGRRTTEKGFVVAPVIEDGEFTEDVGGGVSQYATTLFNAAFFAGLDIPEYKAHSVYISRYPFGREATLAYPGVDLVIRNNTPYGVVIWPTYTASSVTVQLWSTRYATGAQTAQSSSSGCGVVRTTRTRTYVDGRTDQQVYRANYDCSPPDP